MKQKRQTLHKRLARMKKPQDRLRYLIRNGRLQRSEPTDLVEFWQAMLALVRLDELTGNENDQTDAVIYDAGQLTLEAIAPAIAKWDAGFFEDVAKAMRCAASAQPINKRLALVEIALATGEWKPSDVAKMLTTNCPDSYESELRQVRREFAQRRGDK
jgi:hypothetical protein